MSDEPSKGTGEKPSAIVGDLPDPIVVADPEVERSAYEAAMAIRGFSLSDALGEHARKLKRNLMVWSGLAVLVTYYSMKLTRVPWFDIELPKGEIDITPLLVFIPLAYSLVSFIVQAWADISLWQTRLDLQVFRGSFNVLHRLNQFLHTIIASTQQRPTKLFDWENVALRIKAASKASEMASDAFCKTVGRARRTTRLNALMGYLWEFALPAIVGVLAVAYSVRPAWRVVVALTPIGWQP